MRLALTAAFGLVSVLVPAVLAQRNLNPIGNYSNILTPGIPPTGGPQSGASQPGPRTMGQGGRSASRRSMGGGTLVVPYPIFMDPFYSGYSAGYGTVHPPPPGVYDPIFGGYTPPYAIAPGSAPQAASPTVVINQNFQTDTIRPQFRDYSNVPLPEPGVTMAPPAPPDAAVAPSAPLADDQPTIFLIALQDQTVLTAIAYWVQGDTLNYITLKGAQNRVSLALVDRDLSKQLNDERHIPFRLPAPR
jgi:hypothetical protein